MQITIENISSDNNGGVVSVKWSMSAFKNGIEIKDIGLSKFTPNQSASDFIPFDQLKESDVIGWVSKNINVQVVEQRLAENISLAEKTNNVVLPWAIASLNGAE